MNMFCEVFGHKFIAAIPTNSSIITMFTGIEYKELDEPICKRCGLTQKQIADNEPKGKR